MKFFVILLSIFISIFLIGFSGNSSSEPWQLKKFEDGISIYTRLAENSKYKELKAVYQIKTSLSSIIALLNDAESYPLWVYRCEKSKVILKKSDQHLFRYQSIVAPWPVDNRDVVVEVRTYQDEKTKIVNQKVDCKPSFSPEVDGHVRILEFRALWTLTPLKNGIVEVEYQLLVNPGGNIPAWLINMAIIDGPFETSVHMKTMLMKEKYQKTVYPFISNPE